MNSKLFGMFCFLVCGVLVWIVLTTGTGPINYLIAGGFGLVGILGLVSGFLFRMRERR